MKHVKSTLNKIIQEAWAMKDLKEAKKFVIDYLQDCSIKEHDKKKMIFDISQITNITRFQTYLANSLLKYEGLGVS